MPPRPAPQVRIRGMILTAGIAAITIMGTMYGASLKTEQETKERRKRATEPGSEDELIAALETRRRALAQTKLSWERKAESLRERVASKSQRNIGGAGTGSTSGNETSGK